MDYFKDNKFKCDKVTIEVENCGDHITLCFIGDIDLNNPDQVFSPFFDKIHSTVLKDKLSYVEINFEKLRFMNSSGIKTLIKWITNVTPLPEENRYKFKIVASSKIVWQESSVKILSMLAPSMIDIVLV